jgi:hypothetical protein
MLPAGDFILDEQGEKLAIGELLLDGLSVTALQGIEDPREAKLFEHRSQLRHGVHGINLL